MLEMPVQKVLEEKKPQLSPVQNRPTKSLLNHQSKVMKDHSLLANSSHDERCKGMLQTTTNLFSARDAHKTASKRLQLW